MNIKILIMTGVAVVLLAGGGGGYFMLANGPKPVAPLPPIALPVTRYVKLDPLHVSQMPADGKSFRMLLSVVLEVPNPDHAILIEKLMPKLRDAFIRELHGRPLGHNRNWAPDDFEIVKQRLLTQTERVLGPGFVSNILVQQAMRIGG